MRERQSDVRNILLNFDDVDVDQVDDAVLYPDPNIDHDDIESFGDDNSNVGGIQAANFHPPNVEDGQVDLAVGVALLPPAAVDHLPDVGDHQPPVDVYAFGEQSSFLDTTVPLPDGWIERTRAKHIHEEHGHYSDETDYDCNSY